MCVLSVLSDKTCFSCSVATLVTKIVEPPILWKYGIVEKIVFSIRRSPLIYCWTKIKVSKINCTRVKVKSCSCKPHMQLRLYWCELEIWHLSRKIQERKKAAKQTKKHARTHWRSSSTEGCLSPKVVFHQRLFSTYHNTLVDLIFVRTVYIPNLSFLPCLEVA